MTSPLTRWKHLIIYMREDTSRVLLIFTKLTNMLVLKVNLLQPLLLLCTKRLFIVPLPNLQSLQEKNVSLLPQLLPSRWLKLLLPLLANTLLLKLFLTPSQLLVLGLQLVNQLVLKSYRLHYRLVRLDLLRVLLIQPVKSSIRLTHSIYIL